MTDLQSQVEEALGGPATMDELLLSAKELASEAVEELDKLGPISNTDQERVALARARNSMDAGIFLIDRIRARL